MRLGIVTIDGAAPNLQRNFDNANDVFQAEANVWVYPTGSVTEEAPDLLVLDQDDCRGGSRHSVSDEEDALFDLGRHLGAAIVCYNIQNDGGPISAEPRIRRDGAGSGAPTTRRLGPLPTSWATSSAIWVMSPTGTD